MAARGGLHWNSTTIENLFLIGVLEFYAFS